MARKIAQTEIAPAFVTLTNESEMSANKSALAELPHTFFTLTGRKDFRIAQIPNGLPLGKIEMAILDADEYEAKCIIDLAITGEDDSRYIA